MSISRPYCLSIAGFDPSGGAGVLADIKTFEQFETMGLSAITAITYQNDSEFIGVNWLSDKEIINQLEPLKHFPVKCIKIGLVKNIDSLSIIVGWLKDNYPQAPIVWDPILKASAGFKFHSNPCLTENLLQEFALITPNYNEYLELNTNGDLDGAVAVLVKGGHNKSAPGTDLLIQQGDTTEITGVEFENKADKHGTGCVLSAAITANIARGLSLPDACSCGKNYVENFIQSNNERLGYHKR